LKVERESQFNTAGGSELQVRGAAVLNDRLANDVLEMACTCTAVRRTTIECCVCWCGTKCWASRDKQKNFLRSQRIFSTRIIVH